MKSTKSKILTFFLLIGILSFASQSTASLLADEDFDEIDDEVSSLIQRFDEPVLVELSNRLIKMASQEEQDLDYYNAIKHYRQGLRIREKLNLHSTKSFANLLLLTSMSEHNFGASCDAKEHAEKAKDLFLKLNHDKEARIAENEIVEYKNACLVMFVSSLD